MQSLIQLVVSSTLFYLCGWLTGSHRVHLLPRGLGLGSWCFVTALPSSLTLFSLYAVVVTLFDLFWKLHYSPFFPCSRHNNDFCLTFQIDADSFTHWLVVFFFVYLHGKEILHLFNNVALLSSFFTVNGSKCNNVAATPCGAWPDWTGPNRGRHKWAEDWMSMGFFLNA